MRQLEALWKEKDSPFSLTIPYGGREQHDMIASVMGGRTPDRDQRTLPNGYTCSEALFLSFFRFFTEDCISLKKSLFFGDNPENFSGGWILSFRNGKPFKVTFTGALFFPGFEGKNEIIGMVRTYIGKTAPECLVSDSVLFTVFTFPFFGHGTVL
jgi:hypothetical protein